jgi:hypothetical protein
LLTLSLHRDFGQLLPAQLPIAPTLTPVRPNNRASVILQGRDSELIAVFIKGGRRERGQNRTDRGKKSAEAHRRSPEALITPPPQFSDLLRRGGLPFPFY